MLKKTTLLIGLLSSLSGFVSCASEDGVDSMENRLLENEESPCNLVDCMPGFTCEVDINFEAICVPEGEHPCNLVDCRSGFSCELDDLGEAICVPF